MDERARDAGPPRQKCDETLEFQAKASRLSGLLPETL